MAIPAPALFKWVISFGPEATEQTISCLVWQRDKLVLAGNFPELALAPV